MVGIDEVGRGAWAGPLLAVAAQMVHKLPAGLKDSKKLSSKKRQEYSVKLQKSCNFGLGWVMSSEIDNLGLTKAMKLAVQRAFQQLEIDYKEEIIMDGTINYCPSAFSNVKCIVKADDKYSIVSAASIYAKVARDQRMTDLDLQYSNYGFKSNKGYGTKFHRQALNVFGICDVHRKSFKPIRQVIENDQ